MRLPRTARAPSRRAASLRAASRRAASRGLVAALAVLTSAGGCKDPAPAQDPAAPTPAATDPAATTPAATAPTTAAPTGKQPPVCEPGAVLGGGDLRWIPSTARVAITVDLDAPDLDGALAKLGELSRDGEHELPLMLDLELSMLGAEVPLVRRLLDEVGLRPRQLVKVHDAARRPAWIVPAPCDLGPLRAALAERWQVRLRETVGGWLGGPPAAADFPFDVVLLAGDRMLLTPRGAAVPVSSWLTRESSDAPRDPAALGADPADAARLHIGDALQAARDAGDAAVVVASAGLSLLNPGTDPTRARTPDAVRTLAASGASISEDPHRRPAASSAAP